MTEPSEAASDLTDRIRCFLSDTDAPWYASDLVPLVADLCDENERLEKKLNSFLPFIIEGKDVGEHFVKTISFLRDSAEKCRERDGEYGSPSAVCENVCDDFELVLEFCNQQRREIERLKQQIADRDAVIKNLKSALTGAWLNYDAIPYQLATEEYDAMESKVLVESMKLGKVQVIQTLYRMNPNDIEAVLREGYENYNLVEAKEQGDD